MEIGRRVLGLGAILLGGVGLAFGHASLGHQPLREILAYVGDAVLVLGGIAINLRRPWAGCGAIMIACVFAVSVALQLPGLPRDWRIWVTWQDLAEPIAMGMGAVIAWRLLGREADARRMLAARAAKLVFGLCLLVFGVSHFVYLKFTASLVPAWLPPSQTAWAYITGVAHIAAGLAILSGVMARQAAILLTAMFVGFGLLVHLPSIIRMPYSHDNWSENGVNLVLVGAAWCLADWLARARARAS